MIGLDRRAVRRSFEGAAGGYEAAAIVQAEVRARLLERLTLTTIAPHRILDLGAGPGGALKPLARHYHKSMLVAADLSQAMLRQARRRRPRFRHVGLVNTRAEQLPFASASFDLVFSNLMLQWCPEPDPALREIRRVLGERALFLFSTFGPDTLRELRAAWAEADDNRHVHDFADMHDLGDALVRAGFAEPVMDVETLTVTYRDVSALMQDLRQIGARNAAETRSRGLMGPRRLAVMKHAYEAFRNEGRLPATFEVVYGTAWTPIALPAR